MAGEKIQRIFCYKMEVRLEYHGPKQETEGHVSGAGEKVLAIYLASVTRGALGIFISEEREEGPVSFFSHIFERKRIVPDKEKNLPLINGVMAALYNKKRDFRIQCGFSLPPFTWSVLKAIQSIPYGSTRTYGDIGALVGKPKGARAVGQALKRNPLPIIFP